MKGYILLVGLVIFALTKTQGQEIRTLAFQEVLEIALEQNVQLNIQRNQLELAEMQRDASYAALAPSVGASVSATRSKGNSFNQNEGKVVNGTFSNVNGGINGSVTIFNGFRLVNTVRSSSNQLEAQLNTVSRTTQDVINTVTGQYLQVLLDQELLQIANENYETQQRQFEQVEFQVTLGTKSPVDQYNQNAQLKNAELLMLQAEFRMENDKSLLAQTLLMDPLALFNVERPGWSIDNMQAIIDLDDLLETAQSSRPDYLSALSAEQAQHFGMLASRAFLLPSVTASAGLGSAYNKTHSVPASLQRSFENQFFQDNVRSSLSVGVNIPIFNRFQGRLSYVNQQIAYRNAQLNTERIEVQLRRDVLFAYRNFELARKSYAINVEQLEASSQAYTMETERYNLGITSLIEYTQANNIYIQAQAGMAQAEYNLLFQKIMLDYAVGTLEMEGIQQ